jgi:hypothetical protein
MTDVDDVDRILAADDAPAPSSRFAARVMEAVEQTAVDPEPLPFPWVRLAWGIAACLGTAGMGAALVDGFDLTGIGRALAPIARTLAPNARELGYSVAAAVGSLAVVRLQLRRYYAF